MFHELGEPILLSACWMSLRTQMKSEMRPYVDIYVRLASVCDRFYEVVRDKRFRRIIKRTFTGLSYLLNVSIVLFALLRFSGLKLDFFETLQAIFAS